MPVIVAAQGSIAEPVKVTAVDGKVFERSFGLQYVGRIDRLKISCSSEYDCKPGNESVKLDISGEVRGARAVLNEKSFSVPEAKSVELSVDIHGDSRLVMKFEGGAPSTLTVRHAQGVTETVDLNALVGEIGDGSGLWGGVYWVQVNAPRTDGGPNPRRTGMRPASLVMAQVLAPLSGAPAPGGPGTVRR